MMMNEQIEGVVILCKCGEMHKTFGIRAEKKGINSWSFTWAFPIKEVTAKREGYDRTSIKGDITFADEYPGCPYCGRISWTVCTCGHLNCNILKNNLFTCEWCGLQGTVEDYDGSAITAGSDL